MSPTGQLVAGLALAGAALAFGCSQPTEPLGAVKIAKCGDGIVQEGEQCDDGNFADGDSCLSSCRVASCGDGIVQVGVEQCDDGNVRDGDGCESSCTAGVGCGNGILEPGEACDDGNSSNGDACLASCQLPKCGDGFAQLGVEQCDDGNNADGDGCNADCTLAGPAGSSCPGLELAVSTAAASNVVGNTTDKGDDFGASCGGAGSPDVVYQVVPKTSGWLVVQLTGINTGDPVLSVHAQSCDGGVELGCSDATAANGTEYLAVEVEAGKPYWVIADGGNGAGTAFSLELSLQDSVPGDTCPGTPVTISLGQEIEIEGDTALATSIYKGEEACGVSKGTKELVYSITPTKSGKLTVDVAPEFDAVVYARVGSCTHGMQVACADASWMEGGPEKTTFDVVGGAKYSIFIDGFQGSAGKFSMFVSLD